MIYYFCFCVLLGVPLFVFVFVLDTMSSPASSPILTLTLEEETMMDFNLERLEDSIDVEELLRSPTPEAEEEDAQMISVPPPPKVSNIEDIASSFSQVTLKKPHKKKASAHKPSKKKKSKYRVRRKDLKTY